MRKSNYEMTREDALCAFDESPFVTLSCIRANGLPYAVALSMVRKDNEIYFHCAKEGEKIDALKLHPNVCVNAVMQYEYADFSTYYASVCVDGVVQEVVNEQEKLEALRRITERFVPAQLESFEDEVSKCLHVTGIYKIEIINITGKKKLRKS